MAIYDEKTTYELMLNDKTFSAGIERTICTCKDSVEISALGDHEIVELGATPNDISPKLQLVLDFYNQTFAAEIATAQAE